MVERRWNMNVIITLQSEWYEWVKRTAKKSNKTVDQFIQDALKWYKSDIESGNNPKKDKNWTFR